MHHIISNIDKTINLQQYIDNRDGDKRIGLKCITYGVGWYNVIDEYLQKTGERPHKIADGYYSFQQIADVFQGKNITLSVNETNGIASLITTDELKISKGLKLMLGFGNKRQFAANETHYGEKAIDFAIHKSLYVHLEQLNTAYNHFNGTPSTILASAPIMNEEFGDITTVRFENPEYRCLMNDAITELKLEIRDENNNKIINRLPINCVLELIK